MKRTSVKVALKLAFAATAVTVLGAPAFADDGWRDRDDRGRYEHRERHWDQGRDRGDIHLRGPGVDNLNPWFRNAKAGRRFAAERAGTHISDRDARMLNREFRHRDRDGRDDRWR